jgi:O-acetyl-ADP-ribose deacetylase
MPGIRIIKGDICVANVDAIVNAANTQMLGGGGVDGAIHRAAGPALLEACRQVAEVDGVRCQIGEAQITTAGRLSAKYVIHAVGPRYSIDTPAAKLLADAYQNSLDLCCKYSCESVALPAISCGVFGYPYAEAAEIAIASCRSFENRLAITFYLSSDDIVKAWNAVLAS